MWEAILNNGENIHEGQAKWSDIKEDVKTLKFHYHDIVFELPSNGTNYKQATTGSAPLKAGSCSVEVESRWIGFSPDGKIFLKMRFDQKRKKVSVEIEP